MLYVTLSNSKVCVQHFGLYKLPKSKLTNVNILCLVQFGSVPARTNECSYWFGPGTAVAGPYDHYLPISVMSRKMFPLDECMAIRHYYHPW